MPTSDKCHERFGITTVTVLLKSGSYLALSLAQNEVPDRCHWNDEDDQKRDLSEDARKGVE